MSQDRQTELFNYRKAVLRLWNLPIAPLHTPLLCIAQPEHAREAGGGAFSNLDQLLTLAQQRSLPTRVRVPVLTSSGGQPACYYYYYYYYCYDRFIIIIIIVVLLLLLLVLLLSSSSSLVVSSSSLLHGMEAFR